MILTVPPIWAYTVATTWQNNMAVHIGVRELKNNASKIVRAVREELAEFVITVHGEPVAVLKPLTAEDAVELRKKRVTTALDELDQLALEIQAAWTAPQTASEILEALRDEDDSG